MVKGEVVAVIEENNKHNLLIYRNVNTNELFFYLANLYIDDVIRRIKLTNCTITSRNTLRLDKSIQRIDMPKISFEYVEKKIGKNLNYEEIKTYMHSLNVCNTKYSFFYENNVLVSDRGTKSSIIQFLGNEFNFVYPNEKEEYIKYHTKEIQHANKIYIMNHIIDYYLTKQKGIKFEKVYGLPIRYLENEKYREGRQKYKAMDLTPSEQHIFMDKEYNKYSQIKVGCVRIRLS